MELEELREVVPVRGLPDERLEALCEVGEEVTFSDGEELFHEGKPADFWWILIEGNVQLVRRAGRESPVVIMTMENPGQWAGGFQAWNAGGNYMATGRGVGSGRMFRVAAERPRAARSRMVPVQRAPDRGLLPDRALDGHDDSPPRVDGRARPARRRPGPRAEQPGSGQRPRRRRPSARRATRCLSSLTQLAERSLSAEQFVALDSMRRELDVSGTGADSLEAMDREEALERLARIARHRGRVAYRARAGGRRRRHRLVRAGGRPARTRAPRAGVRPGWRARCRAHALLGEIKDSTSRISALVNDFKSYSQLDRASVQTIDVTKGLDDTLVMLKHKLGDGVTVGARLRADVPQIEAFPAELNQVWTNLIANAIDAVDGDGTIRIATRAEPEFIVVEIADDGPGMPPDVQARAFEPFFTTKDVGKGTGLGLDISRRIIADRHHGQIVIASEPGNTVISVRVPRAGT